MNSEKLSQEFASIDESPVTSRSIDTDLARRNLQKLQEHVNKQFSNLPNTGLGDAGAMSSEKHQEEPHSLPVGRHLIERLPSIKNDDELFKGESDSEHSECDSQSVKTDRNSREQLSENESGVSQILYSRTDTDQSDLDNKPVRTTENKADSGLAVLDISGSATNIPNFDEIGISFCRSSSSSGTAEYCGTVENSFNKEEADEASKFVENETHGESDNEVTNRVKNKEETFDFKVEYRGRRSQSDVKEKRQRFSQHVYDDVVEEVFEPEYTMPVRKSNSLPDLILSSSGSSSSSNSVYERKSPDVILCQDQNGAGFDENQRQRKTLKDSFEGRSSLEKHECRSIGIKKTKPSFGRSVSFSEKTDCRYYQVSEPEMIPVLNETYENSGNGSNNASTPSGKQFPSEGNDQAKNAQIPESPKSPTADSRRQLFSKSSGYHTGSDHSRESHDTQHESFQSDTFHGEGSDLQKQGLSERNPNEIQEEAERLSGHFNSGTSTSNSSNETILEALIEESLKYRTNLKAASFEEPNRPESEQVSVEGPSPELPLLSIIDRSPQSSLNDYRDVKQDLEVTGGFSFKNVACSDRSLDIAENTDKNLLLKPLQSAYSFRRSQSTLGQSMPGSIGNVPKLGLLDESVVLAPSLVVAVNEEDQKLEEQVRKKYANTAGSLAHIDEEGAAAVMGKSLSSYLVG